MSRCFPFPPPGYEKKTRTDDVNLLKKEKDKEKKHKKEKKNKEKKEKKEKREKDRSDGKHRDKTEKHREKKKDKETQRDQDKDKEKKNVADEKKFPVQNEVRNTDRPIEKEHKLKDKNSIFQEKLRRNHSGSNEEKPRDNANSVKENKDSKFIQELDRRIKYDGSGTQMSRKFPVMGNKKDEATVRVLAKGNAPWLEGKERDKDKTIEARKSDGLGITVFTQPSVNAIVPNHAGIFQPRAEGMPKLSEKNFEKMQESKEPINENRGNDNQGDKRKDRDKDKKGPGKDKDRDKEKKKDEKAKEQVEHKNLEHCSKLKESNKIDPFCINSSSQPPEDNFKNVVGDQNFKKRKGFEPNGVLHANDNWPNKLPRPSSHPLSENGMQEPRQISVSCPDRQEAATNLKVDYKERKINGIIEARLISAPSSKPVCGTTSANQVDAVSVKSPHPDTKYLKQVYSVPQMDTWCELDDQGWLFNSSSLQQSKPRVESSDTGEIPLLWAEALQIKHVDIYALPYVIPY